MEVSSWPKLLLLVFACRVCLYQTLEVSTPKGKIIGSDTLRTRDGRVIYGFTNIPYAKPPVGSLRFKEAQPPDPWSEPLDATINAPFCPQIANLSHRYPQVRGQEDCLVLNVYSPKVEKSAKLPVMIFIHGGAFSGGGSVLYGPELLLDKEIVLVTINYRLGALGFLSTGDETIPANIGMKDQALGIRWVHENIENFGGNPELVTVFGESAGSVSTHFNLLSPLNKGLIHRGIAMSGTGHCPWALIRPELARDRTRALAVLCGCPPNPSEELLKCMQAVPIPLILEMSRRFQDWLLAPPIVFGPTIEPAGKNAFLSVDPRTVESHIPLMLGVTSGEGALFVPVLISAGEEYENDLKEHPQYFLSKVLLLWSEFPKDRDSVIAEHIIEFYFGNKSVDFKATEEIIEMLTDSWFLHGAMETAAKYSGEVYLYFYDYPHSDSLSIPLSGSRIEGTVSHGDDLLDLFPLQGLLPNRTWSENEIKISKRSIDIWTDFAVNGKPSQQTNLGWEPIGNTSKKSRYLHITAELSVGENLLPKRVEFWRSLTSDQS